MTDNDPKVDVKTVGRRFVSAALYFIVFIVLISFLNIDLPEKLVGPCLFRSVTGLYCPGCGGTTSVRDLLHGRPFKSFFDNPTVIYTLYLLWLYTASFLLDKISRGRVKAVKIRPWHFYILIALILICWLIKNLMLLLPAG